MNWNKYCIMLSIDCGLLLRPQSKGLALIEDSEWHYPFFNCDMLRTVLSQAIEVLYHGYTPYIALNNRQEGETNWDTFFRQPFDCQINNEWGGVKRIYNYSDMRLDYGYYISTPYSFHHYRRWCRIFHTLVKLNQPTQNYVDEEYQRLFNPKERVLGVLCRGTDYIGYKGLPIQPKVDTVIKDVQDWMQKYDYQRIYLATECQSIFDKFDKAFPDLVITNQRTYYDTIMCENKLPLIGDVSFNRANDNYLKGIQYLSSLVLLSRCNALLSGNCGGALFTLFYNNMKYEHIRIYKLGTYK